MKGTIINLDGELVCVFPFTNDTDFESLSHNDLESRGISSNEVGCPIAIVEERKDELYFGWCFISTEITKSQVPILRRDAGTIVSLALDNDRWAKDQMKTGTCAGCGQSVCACIPAGDDQSSGRTDCEEFCIEKAEEMGMDCSIDEQEERDGGVKSLVKCDLCIPGGTKHIAFLTVFSSHYEVNFVAGADEDPYESYSSDAEFPTDEDRILAALNTVYEEIDGKCRDENGDYCIRAEERWTVNVNYRVDAPSLKKAFEMVECGDVQYDDHRVIEFETDRMTLE